MKSTDTRISFEQHVSTVMWPSWDLVQWQSWLNGSGLWDSGFLPLSPHGCAPALDKDLDVVLFQLRLTSSLCLRCHFLLSHEIISASVPFPPESLDTVFVQEPSHLNVSKLIPKESFPSWGLYTIPPIATVKLSLQPHSHFSVPLFHLPFIQTRWDLSSASVVAIKLLLLRPLVTLLLDEPLKALFYEYFPLLLLKPFSLLCSLLHLRHFIHSSAHPKEFSFHATQLCSIILSLTWLFRSLTWYLYWLPDNRANYYMTETQLTLVQTSKCISNYLWTQTP